jgi:hypothetical protein
LREIRRDLDLQGLPLARSRTTSSVPSVMTVAAPDIPSPSNHFCKF